MHPLAASNIYTYEKIFQVRERAQNCTVQCTTADLMPLKRTLVHPLETQIIKVELGFLSQKNNEPEQNDS